MNVTTLQITARDPIVARDGRPFGAEQGNRMRSLSWPLPSVVAGSFRTALVKADPRLDFADGMPERLRKVEVAGVFPSVGNDLYLPAPSDAVAEPTDDGKTIKLVHRSTPRESGGCDFPDDLPLWPVLVKADFKPMSTPAWWPVAMLSDWLVGKAVNVNEVFLNAAAQETRDHVRLDANTGTAAEAQLFTTAGLNLTCLPRYGVDESKPFRERFAEVVLNARVTITDAGFGHLNALSIWHQLGGERRLVHWRPSNAGHLWECPAEVKAKLATATHVRMLLATPAVFEKGWKPGWLRDGLVGILPGTGVRLQLVGVSNGRWKAVSGWSLARINATGKLDPGGKPGAKPIRRMVPAGSIYFFEKLEGDGVELAGQWLKPVSDDEQERRDGFGLAVWGIWSPSD